MRIKNALLSNIIILLLAGTTEFIFNSNALAVPGDLYASDVATNSATGLNSPEVIFPPKADFNGDGNSDILWQNNSSGERVIWLMNGTTFSSSVSLGIVTRMMKIVGSEDFNADGSSDILWQNSTTGERLIWLMNGTIFGSSVSLGIVGTSWNIAGAADYSGDGKTDILWQNSVTGERVIWLMDGTSLSSTVSLGIVGTAWDIRNY